MPSATDPSWTGTPVGAALDALWESTAPTFRARVDTVEAHVADLLTGGLGAGRDEARSAAHKLAGTMGMFGMALGSELALELETMLDAGNAPTALELDRMAEIVNHLREDVTARSSPTPRRQVARAPRASRSVVAVVGRDSAMLESLAWTLEGRNVDVARGSSVAGIDPEEIRPFDAVCVDAASVDDPMFAVASAARLQTPVVVLADTRELSTRLGYVRAGATTVVSCDVGVERLADLLHRMSDPRDRPFTAVAIGIEPHDSVAAASGFAEAGCSVEVLPRASMLGDAIERLDPHTVVIGSATSEVEPLEALAVIAADPVWSSRQIAVLAPDDMTLASLTADALALGADDIVAPTQDWTALAQRLRLRARRSTRSVGSQPDAAAHRSRLVATLDAQLAMALSASQPFSIVYFHANRVAELNQTDGYEAGDRRLSRIEGLIGGLFRGGDSAGRWAGAGFVAGLEADRAAAVDRLTGALAELQEAGAPCVGAVATAPDDGDTLASLLATANRRALGSGTDSRAPDAPQTRQVMVVEDDPIVATLVRELLESEGHTVEIVVDGPAAATALTDADVADAVDLVLLDITLPGLDGFGVLRAMQRANTLSRVPVVVLTARVRTEEITTALDLGAVDHVAKPFSPAVLMRRVERALALARP